MSQRTYRYWPGIRKRGEFNGISWRGERTVFYGANEAKRQRRETGKRLAEAGKGITDALRLDELAHSLKTLTNSRANTTELETRLRTMLAGIIKPTRPKEFTQCS